MTRVIASILIVCFSNAALGQSARQNTSRTDEIKAAFERIRQSGKDSISGVLFDMRTFNGKLIRVDEDTFTVDSKRKSLPRAVMTIKFTQVLELNGSGVAISYFPDPDLSPFADWNAVKKLSYGDTLEVDSIGGGGVFGVLFRISDTTLTVMDGNRTIEVKRDDVRRVFLARREPHSVGKALKGAGNGAGAVGRGDSSNLGAAAVHGAIMVGAATAGAIGAVARRVPNDRLLIYSN